jgi:hypothetical protein
MALSVHLQLMQQGNDDVRVRVPARTASCPAFVALPHLQRQLLSQTSDSSMCKRYGKGS